MQTFSHGSSPCCTSRGTSLANFHSVHSSLSNFYKLTSRSCFPCCHSWCIRLFLFDDLSSFFQDRFGIVIPNSLLTGAAFCKDFDWCIRWFDLSEFRSHFTSCHSKDHVGRQRLRPKPASTMIAGGEQLFVWPTALRRLKRWCCRWNLDSTLLYQSWAETVEAISFCRRNWMRNLLVACFFHGQFCKKFFYLGLEVSPLWLSKRTPVFFTFGVNSLMFKLLFRWIVVRYSCDVPPGFSKSFTKVCTDWVCDSTMTVVWYLVAPAKPCADRGLRFNQDIVVVFEPIVCSWLQPYFDLLPHWELSISILSLS